MYFGKTNSGDNTVNTNTTFHIWYSDTSMFTIGAWNKQLSLKFQPCTGVDAEGIRQYSSDKSRIIFTSISPENAMIWLEDIYDTLLPKIKAGEKVTVSLPVSSGEQRKVLTLGYDGEKSYIEVVTSMNENGIASDDTVLRHTFNQRSSMINYDYRTGNHEELIKEPELLLFIDKLKRFGDLVPMVSHSIRHDNAMRSSYANKNFSGNNQTSNSSTGAMNTPSYNAPVTNYNGDMGDFLPFN